MLVLLLLLLYKLQKHGSIRVATGPFPHGSQGISYVHQGLGRPTLADVGTLQFACQGVNDDLLLLLRTERMAPHTEGVCSDRVADRSHRWGHRRLNRGMWLPGTNRQLEGAP